jgi:predicted negative regulator of RcsB-dependent stress response
MTDYSEEEQVERLRKWWDENGTSIIVAVVLSVGALLGWRYWQDSTERQASEASAVYQQMIDAVEQSRVVPGNDGPVQQVRSSAEQLIAEYPSSAYADYAHLALASLAVQNESYDDAATQLRAVMDKPATDALGWTARARLARVLLHTADLDGASKVLNASWPAAWQGQVFELRGDVARAQGDVGAARKAYQSALETLANDGAGHRELVQMKLDDLVPAS